MLLHLLKNHTLDDPSNSLQNVGYLIDYLSGGEPEDPTVVPVAPSSRFAQIESNGDLVWPFSSAVVVTDKRPPPSFFGTNKLAVLRVAGILVFILGLFFFISAIAVVTVVFVLDSLHENASVESTFHNLRNVPIRLIQTTMPYFGGSYPCTSNAAACPHDSIFNIFGVRLRPFVC